MIYPDWKIKLAEQSLRKKALPNDIDVQNLISVLNGTCKNPVAIDLTNEALTIYRENSMSREVLEGCLLCDDYTIEDIQIITGMSYELIEIYRLFCFDLKVFSYRLKKFEYVRTYKNDDYPDGALYKKWALSVGIRFFKWHLGIDNRLVPKEVLTNLIGDTFFRAKEHLNESLTSAVSKEALKWMKMAIDSSMAIHRIEEGLNERSSGDIRDQVRIALEYRDDTKTTHDISDAEII
jgi:hypothetical protein